MTQTYIDSRGVEIVFEGFSTHLETIHIMATAQRTVPGRNASDDEIEMAAAQTIALDSVSDLIVNHHETIDETFGLPEGAATVGREDLHSLFSAQDGDLDRPTGHLRAVGRLALDGAIDPKLAGRSVENAEEIDRQQIALEMLGVFLKHHGAELDRSITTIPIPGF